MSSSIPLYFGLMLCFLGSFDIDPLPLAYFPVLPFIQKKDKCKEFKLSCKEIQKLWFCKYHWQCSGRFNSPSQLLYGQYWDDWAPTSTTPTKPPVCSRHLAILW